MRVPLPLDGLGRELVEEALCFGWVDSRPGTVDALRTKLYVAPRKRGSGWASTNKARIARLEAEGRMAPAGLAALEAAKADGSWALLDTSEMSNATPPHAVTADWFAALPSARRASASDAWACTLSLRSRALASPLETPLSCRTTFHR